jgi:uncharacterized membrane-anchored protein
VPGAPAPDEIFDRAIAEGDRRMDQSLLELAATSVIAGWTIFFGVVAGGLGLVTLTHVAQAIGAREAIE